RAGMWIGLATLTKGPVAWLYVIFPVLLAPFWMVDNKSKLSWYGGCALAFVLSTIPVLLWLVPVLKASNPDFAFSLIWEQTAGRISGKMQNAHHRPIYFYLPLLPVLFLPWAFFPSFWKGLRGVAGHFKTQIGLRFLACWILPVVVAFSFISGKQPHYLVPLLPGALIFIAVMMSAQPRCVMTVSAAMIALTIGGQVIASHSFLKKYDLTPIARYVKQNAERDWAFAPQYQGEVTFLGRLNHHMDENTYGQMGDWFQSHPDGIAVIRYDKQEEIDHYKMVMSIPYRSKNIGIFEKR
ncbi:MAG: ArnT family glycosyltransferase, partial [Bdellovibrionales bacterium]